MSQPYPLAPHPKPNQATSHCSRCKLTSYCGQARHLSIYPSVYLFIYLYHHFTSYCVLLCYCGQACQRQAWKAHKLECVPG